MTDRDIEISPCNGGFGLHDVPVTVVALGYDGFGLAFRSAADFVHLPENTR